MDSASKLYTKFKSKIDSTFKSFGKKAMESRSSFKSYIEKAGKASEIKNHPLSNHSRQNHQLPNHSLAQTTNTSDMRNSRDAGDMQNTSDIHDGGDTHAADKNSVTNGVQIDSQKTAQDKKATPHRTRIAPEDEIEEDVIDAKQIVNSKTKDIPIAKDPVSSATKSTDFTYVGQVQVARTIHSGGPRIYADYASLTPIDPRVKKVMVDAMDDLSANPSSLYSDGVKSKEAIERGRTSIANFFGVQPSEIIFTSGGTESNNLAIRGVIEFCEEQIRDVGADPSATRPHIIISTIEHPSVVEIALDLMQKGYSVSFVPVNEMGLIDPKDIKKALTPETVLVSIMYANNEIGTIQPIKDITREVRHYKKSIGRDASDYPYVHTDACQAVLYEDMRVPSLSVDLMTIDGGKVYGPRSTGILVKRNYVKLKSIFSGGSQEFGYRPGTENTYSILGIKHALDIAHNEREDETLRLRSLVETLRDSILSRLIDICPEAAINGSVDSRLPNNLNICFPGLDAEFMVIRLDALGIMLSSVTSCRANNEDSSSYVIEALGRADCSQSSLRITLGRYTSTLDVAHIAERVVQVVQEQMIAKQKEIK